MGSVAASCSSISGRTRASTASARCRSSRASTRPTIATGFDIVGVETPEFTFEQNAGNVAQAIASDGLRYPVVQDNRYGTWNAWGNQYWPAEYLVDANGQVRHTQFGEGDYAQSEAAIRALLREAGVARLPPPMTAKAIVPSASLATPETYLNAVRAQGFLPQLMSGVHTYPGVPMPQVNQFALRGRWDVGSQDGSPSTPVASGAGIQVGFQAADVYLVLTSAGDLPRHVRVLLDGKPIVGPNGRPRRPWGCRHGPRPAALLARVAALSSAPRADGRGPPGVSAYSFTFG